MSAGQTTLAEILRYNDANIVDAGLTDRVHRNALALNLMAIESSLGPVHQYRKWIGPGSVAGVRAFDEGLELSKRDAEDITINVPYISIPMREDVQKVAASKSGENAYLADVFSEKFASWMDRVEVELVSKLSEGADLTISAGGTGTGLSSAYVIMEGPAQVAIVSGGARPGAQGTLTGGWTKQQVAEIGTDNKFFDAFTGEIASYATLQTGGLFSIVRIANISTSNPLTDDLLYDAQSIMENGRATAVVGNNKVFNLVRKSRIATSQSPQGDPVRPVETAGGLKMLNTFQLKNDEAEVTDDIVTV